MEISLLESILGGIVQGITEFFPVSSSGHLVILHQFFGVERPTIFFDLILHVSTLFAVIVFFWKSIVDLLKKERKTLLLIILASIPAIIVGVLFEKNIESSFKDVRFVSYMLVITGIWLFLGHFIGGLWQRKSSVKEKPNVLQAIFMGIAQAIAIFPGISRSGSTISTGMMFNLKREEAFRFSFLLSIPAILGALVYKLKDVSLPHMENNLLAYVVGGFVSFCIGLLTLKLLYAVVRKQKLHYFGIYCIIVGIAAFLLI